MSMDLMKACSGIITDACVDKHIKGQFHCINNKYQIVANDLVENYMVSEKTKLDRFKVLEELAYQFFVLFIRNKKNLIFPEPKETVKYIERSRREIYKCVNYGKLSLDKIFVNYNYVAMFYIITILATCEYFSVVIKYYEDSFSGFILIIIFQSLLIIISAMLAAKAYDKAKIKERFLRPGSHSKAITYIQLFSPIIIPIISYIIVKFLN